MTSLEDIRILREKTGASLQACKKALEENNGNQEAAIEYLRKAGEAKAAKRSDRDTTNGVVATATGNGKAIILKLACETDFVAKSPDFVTAALNLANDFLANGPNFSPEAIINELGLKMGEKIELSDMKYFNEGVFGTYVHSNKKVGCLVVLNGGNEGLAKDVAMHATAMNPLVISPNQVDTSILDKEREIWTEQLKNEGKPAEIVEKILMGKEKKFREENSLVSQAFVKDPEKTIGQLLGDVQISSFVRVGC